jgi:hypothetical protein
MSGTVERIQLRRTKGWRKPENTIVVTRPTKWGNPFRVGEVGWNPWYPELAAQPEDVVNEYWFEFQGDGLWWEAGECYLTADDVRAELAGKNLACWCPAGQPCHADVLLEIANS